MLFLVAPAFALPLLVERFDANVMPDGWKTAVAVQTGGGKPSAASVEEGALVLRAEPKTKKFTAVTTKKLELRDVSWIRVQARVRTEGVTAVPGVCGAFVRFEGAEMTPAGPCVASDWVSFTRYYQVPEGARDVEVGFLLPTAGTARLDDLLVEPVTPDIKSQNRGAFTYYWLGTDSFREDQLVANDETFDKAVALVGAPPKGKIEYHKYADLDAIEQYTGVRAEAVVRGNAIHTIVRTNPGAIVKVLAQAWGAPPPLLVEGLAVSFAGEYGGRDLRQGSRGLATAGKAPTLAQLLDPTQFAALPPENALPVAGAFVQWLTATKGADAVKSLYGTLKADSSVADNTKALEAALGMKLADADAALRAWW